MLLQASHEVQGRLNAFIKNKFIKTEENSKKYLINLINVLEEEMFELARRTLTTAQSGLSEDYVNHLRQCVGLARKSHLSKEKEPGENNKFELVVFEVEKLFYL